MFVISAAAASANLESLIDQVNDESEPLTIAGERSNAMLVSEDHWRAIQETIYLGSIPGMATSIRMAKNEGLATGSDEFPWG